MICPISSGIIALTVLSLKSTLFPHQRFSIGYADQSCVPASFPKRGTVFFDRPTEKAPCNPVYYRPDGEMFEGDGHFYIRFRVPIHKRVFYQTLSNRCEQVEILDWKEDL